jgi:hypothetical protein
MEAEKTALEIARKYVYGNHDALTDRQEVKDLEKDINLIINLKVNSMEVKNGTSTTSGNKLLSFGNAVIALKRGKMVQRSIWVKDNKFIFCQIPNLVGSHIVPKMSSLPDSVKEEIAKRKSIGDKENIQDAGVVLYKNQIAMCYADNTFVSWAASASDILEEDWIILK